MRDLAVYTLLRLSLFVSSYAVIGGIGVLVFGDASLLVTFVLAALVSAALSWKLLARQRERLALRVQGRAERASAAFEDRRAREDVD